MSDFDSEKVRDFAQRLNRETGRGDARDQGRDTSSNASRSSRRSRSDEREPSQPSPEEVLQDRFEELGEKRRGLLDSSGAVDVTDLSEFRDVTDKRRQIQNELDKIEGGRGEVVIRRPGESLESATRDAASRRARRLSDITDRSVEVTKDVPRPEDQQRRPEQRRDNRGDLQDALLEAQRQRSDEASQRQIIRRALLAESRRRSRPADFREAESPEPLFGGDIPILTPLSRVGRVARRPLDDAVESEQQRVITQSDIPGLERASTRASEFLEGVRQEADSSLVRGDNRVGLSLGREGLDIATGIGFVAAQPQTVASSVGSRVGEAVESGDALDVVPSPQNQALARRRLPFALGAELSTGFIPASGLSRPGRAGTSGRRLDRFGDVDSGDLTSFEPTVIDTRTGQTTLQRLDDVEDIAITDRGVGGATRVPDSQSFLLDEDTGRVTGLSRRGPLGEELASQQPSRFREGSVNEEFVVDRGSRVEQLTGSLDDSQVGGDVVNPVRMQQRLLDEPSSQQRLGSDETFVLENVNTGRRQTVPGDRASSLLESGRFDIVVRNPSLAERTRIRRAREQQMQKQGSGFQTDLTSLRTREARESPSIRNVVEDTTTSSRGLGLGKRGQAQLTRPQSRFDLDTRTNVDIGGVRRTRSVRGRSVFPEPDSQGLSRQLDRLATRRLTSNRFTPRGFSLFDTDTSTSLEGLQSQDSLQSFEPITGLREELSFDTEQSQRVGSIQRQGQRQRQDVDSLFGRTTGGRQRSSSLGRFSSRGRSSRRRVRKPRKRGGLSFEPPSPRTSGDEGKPSQADVFVKRRGNFEKVNDGWLTFEEAQDKGAKIVSNTPARTFKVKSSKQMRRGRFEGTPGFFKDNKHKFRKSKNHSFGKVEKAEFAIETPGEIEGITEKGLRTLRRNRGDTPSGSGNRFGL